jgi:hypothetical protein
MGQPYVQQYTVRDEVELQGAVMRQITNGFEVIDRTPSSVTLIKRKKFSVFWTVVGLFFFLFPFFIYLIVYAAQSDQIVEVRVVTPQAVEPPPVQQVGPVIQMSPDSSEWWDGATWRDAATSTPPQALRSDGGSHWWDGQGWRPVAPTLE